MGLMNSRWDWRFCSWPYQGSDPVSAIGRADKAPGESFCLPALQIQPSSFCCANAFLIVDDNGNVAGYRQAVHDFRAAQGIIDPIQPIDWAGVYWRRSRDGSGSISQASQLDGYLRRSPILPRD
jgi:hypothetical protein